MSPNVKALIDQACEDSDAFATHWHDITERLRFVAHLEGIADNRFAKGHRLWIAQGDDDRGLPRIKLVYLVLGANVTIQVAAIG